jgi:hypothetical protein
MTKINTKIEEDALLKIEEALLKKRDMAAKRIDAWRERNARALKNWKGIEIIRFFREKK